MYWEIIYLISRFPNLFIPPKPFIVKGFSGTSKLKIKSGMPVGYTAPSGRNKKIRDGEYNEF